MTGTAGSIVVALLLLLTAGCARAKPDTPVPEPKTVATRPAAPQAPAKPAVPATPKTTPAAGSARTAKDPAPKVAGGGAPPVARTPVARTPAAAPPLDLKTLTQQLRETKAIGIFTKIALKNQVDDLLDAFRKHYQGNNATLAMTDLRRSFDLLMMKVLTLLQDEDQMLASAIVSSREAIWGVLADPKKFAILVA
jgi:hypothetical protein